MAAQNLTREQAEAILSLARQVGTERQRMFGRRFRQADFVAGVLTAFTALDAQAYVPAEWIRSTLRGQKLFGPE